VASAAVGLLLVAALLAASSYVMGFDAVLADGITLGVLAGAGMILAGVVLLFDLFRDVAAS